MFRFKCALRCQCLALGLEWSNQPPIAERTDQPNLGAVDFADIKCSGYQPGGLMGDRAACHRTFLRVEKPPLDKSACVDRIRHSKVLSFGCAANSAFGVLGSCGCDNERKRPNPPYRVQSPDGDRR